MKPLQVLIADDDESLRWLIARLAALALGDEAKVSLARDGSEAIAWLGSERADVIVTDLHMPGASGLDVACAARRAWPGTQVVLVTGGARAEELRAATLAGMFACIQKPFDVDFFIDTLRAAAERAKPPRLAMAR